MELITNIPTNNNKIMKRYFNCRKCNYLYSKDVSVNIKVLKCDKCRNILNELTENEYLKRTFNYIKNNQTNKPKHINKNKFENMKVNYNIKGENKFRNNINPNNLIINKNNNINMNMNNNILNNNIHINNKINIDNNLTDNDDIFNNNIINNNPNPYTNLANMNKNNNIINNNINNINLVNNSNNINIINNNDILNNINITNNTNINNSQQMFPTNKHINFINNNLAYQPININSNINNINSINNQHNDININISNHNNYNINNYQNPAFQQIHLGNNIPKVANALNNLGFNQNISNLQNNANNINPQILPHNNQNIRFNRQNTTPITQPSYIQEIDPYSNNNNNININNNNNIQNNRNHYKKSKSSNIDAFDFWQRVDNHKEHENNNNPSSNRNNIIPEFPPSPFNNNNHRHNRNMDPMNEILDNFFGDFFNDRPSFNISSNRDSDSPHIIFHHFFSPFGIRENDFSNNYLSNFNRNFFGDFASLLQLSHRGRRKDAHPPASQDALRKLKRFPLEERFCQKKEGKIELPNCCICQCEIELGKETVLLPCGHMYHWDCCKQWLNTNNTCPICRFEIK